MPASIAAMLALLGLWAGAPAAETTTRPAAPARPGATQPGPTIAYADQYEARVHSDAAGKTLPYRLLQPKAIDKDKKFPLVLFLHGAGERGNGNLAQLKNGVAELLASPKAREKFPCFVAVPQCPANGWWAGFTRAGSRPAGQPNTPVAAEQPAEPERLAIEIVAALKKEFPVDNARVYVLGLSMGGMGSWDMIWRYPDTFAAAAPICGGGDISKAPAMAGTPVWAFHGGADKTVPTEWSRLMVKALKDAGATPKYTEYEGVGHNSWTKAFAEPGLLEWMFAQKRPARNP